MPAPVAGGKSAWRMAWPYQMMIAAATDRWRVCRRRCSCRGWSLGMAKAFLQSPGKKPAVNTRSLPIYRWVEDAHPCSRACATSRLRHLPYASPRCVHAVASKPEAAYLAGPRGTSAQRCQVKRSQRKKLTPQAVSRRKRPSRAAMQHLCSNLLAAGLHGLCHGFRRINICSSIV